MEQTILDRQGVAARALLDYAQTGLIALDPDCSILFANDAAKSFLGLDGLTASLTAESCIRLDSAEQSRLALLLERKFQGPLRLKSRAGQTLVAALREEQNGIVLLSLASADTKPDAFGQNVVSQNSLSQDALTGLFDRQGFHDRLAALCTDADQGVAVLRIDLDPQDDAVDDLAHTALIKTVAERLQSIFRGCDAVGRLGPDAFAVAMTALPEVPILAERLVAALDRPVGTEQQSTEAGARVGARSGLRIGASVGIAFSPQHGGDPEALLHAADVALDHATADGGSTVRVFNDDLDLRSRTRHSLADDLRRAIPLQQLELHYQPQTSLTTGVLEGFEALVRWNHPKLGRLSPDKFIPLAEEMGLILPLGEWVLQEACRTAKAWPERLVVAINVSTKQLLDRERLPRAIAATLASTALPARRLELEITENALVRETEALQALTSIRALGVRVSMDDFGIGYSSLSRLRRFPFDKLKIDRSFVQDLARSADAGAVVRAIAALGKGLGMATVAEGVETIEQQAMCRAEGCTHMQGYLVSKPVPAIEVPALIHALGRRRSF